MKPFLLISFSLLILLFLSAGCKKISVPDYKSSELFGSWNYHGNTGGFAGSGESTRYDAGSWIEFTEKGFMKYYVGTKRKLIRRFELSLGHNSNGPTIHRIKYKNDYDDNFKIKGDTLFLSNLEYNGYIFIFTRK